MLPLRVRAQVVFACCLFYYAAFGLLRSITVIIKRVLPLDCRCDCCRDVAAGYS